MKAYIIRGLPGSGKTTLAKAISAFEMAADDYFTSPDGEYKFDPAKLRQAHADCLARFVQALGRGPGFSPVVVHNTFTCRWEMEPYIRAAEERGVEFTIISLYDGGCIDTELEEQNSHGVPLSAIRAMRRRWEMDWKRGNPLPPWER